jgi:hypothetical protein
MVFDFAAELRRARAAASLQPTPLRSCCKGGRDAEQRIDGNQACSSEDVVSWPEAEAAASLIHSRAFRPLELQKFVVGCGVERLSYIPDIVSVEEEEALLKATWNAPKQNWYERRRRDCLLNQSFDLSG